MNDKWVEVLSAEKDMDDRRRSVLKSYPHRCLLPEFDEELADDLARPPRGRDRQMRENLNDRPPPRRLGMDPVEPRFSRHLT